jgi:hypothetical protein
MSSGQSRFQALFVSALQYYERETEIELVEHPIVKRLKDCESVDSVDCILREQAQAISGSQGRDGDRIMTSLKGIVSVLHTLSTSTVLVTITGLVSQGVDRSFISLTGSSIAVTSYNGNFC